MPGEPEAQTQQVPIVKKTILAQKLVTMAKESGEDCIAALLPTGEVIMIPVDNSEKINMGMNLLLTADLSDMTDEGKEMLSRKLHAGIIIPKSGVQLP